MLSCLEKQLNVQLNEVTSEQIDSVNSNDSIKGTMSIHPSRGAFYHRKLSCYCADTPVGGRVCDCHSPVRVEVKDVQEDPVVCGIEHHLTNEQIHLFTKRLQEGYDVNVLDLSTISTNHQNEYAYWKAWRAAKLCKPKKTPD